MGLTYIYLYLLPSSKLLFIDHHFFIDLFLFCFSPMMVEFFVLVLKLYPSLMLHIASEVEYISCCITYISIIKQV